MNEEPSLSMQDVKEVLATKTAPRITEESIKAKIAKVEYVEHGLLTVCFITLTNGWMQSGQSAPASPDNFNREVGKRYAYENAFKPLWQLEGYLLREKLSQQ